jgi:hypothetical protein
MVPAAPMGGRDVPARRGRVRAVEVITESVTAVSAGTQSRTTGPITAATTRSSTNHGNHGNHGRGTHGCPPPGKGGAPMPPDGTTRPRRRRRRDRSTQPPQQERTHHHDRHPLRGRVRSFGVRRAGR